MKLILLTACLLCCALPLFQAADIFTPPPPKTNPKAAYKNYETSAAFLKATRSGEIPELIKTLGYETESLDGDIGVPVVAILRKEYRVIDPKGALSHYEWWCKKAITFLTAYELDGNDEKRVVAFQDAREHMSHGDAGAGFVVAFDSFAKDYSKSVRENLANKKKAEQEQGQTMAVANAKAATALAEEDAKQYQTMAATRAKAASIQAEEETKAAAIRGAIAAQEKIREQKLKDALDSPPYKIWQVSLQIEAGLRMVEEAKQILGKDDAVVRESGVTDLVMRRAAGERVVAGKTLVEQAFATYKQLGGKALKPEDVRATEDPAMKYR